MMGKSTPCVVSVISLMFGPNAEFLLRAVSSHVTAYAESPYQSSARRDDGFCGRDLTVARSVFIWDINE